MSSVSDTGGGDGEPPRPITNYSVSMDNSVANNNTTTIHQYAYSPIGQVGVQSPYHGPNQQFVNVPTAAFQTHQHTPNQENANYHSGAGSDNLTPGNVDRDVSAHVPPLTNPADAWDSVMYTNHPQHATMHPSLFNLFNFQAPSTNSYGAQGMMQFGQYPLPYAFRQRTELATSGTPNMPQPFYPSYQQQLDASNGVVQRPPPYSQVFRHHNVALSGTPNVPQSFHQSYQQQFDAGNGVGQHPPSYSQLDPTYMGQLDRAMPTPILPPSIYDMDNVHGNDSNAADTRTLKKERATRSKFAAGVKGNRQRSEDPDKTQPASGGTTKKECATRKKSTGPKEKGPKRKAESSPVPNKRHKADPSQTIAGFTNLDLASRPLVAMTAEDARQQATFVQYLEVEDDDVQAVIDNSDYWILRMILAFDQPYQETIPVQYPNVVQAQWSAFQQEPWANAMAVFSDKRRPNVAQAVATNYFNVLLECHQPDSGPRIITKSTRRDVKLKASERLEQSIAVIEKLAIIRSDLAYGIHLHELAAAPKRFAKSKVTNWWGNLRRKPSKWAHVKQTGLSDEDGDDSDDEADVKGTAAGRGGFKREQGFDGGELAENVSGSVTHDTRMEQSSHAATNIPTATSSSTTNQGVTSTTGPDGGYQDDTATGFEQHIGNAQMQSGDWTEQNSRTTYTEERSLELPLDGMVGAEQRVRDRL